MIMAPDFCAALTIDLGPPVGFSNIEGTSSTVEAEIYKYTHTQQVVYVFLLSDYSFMIRASISVGLKRISVFRLQHSAGSLVRCCFRWWNQMEDMGP